MQIKLLILFTIIAFASAQLKADSIHLVSGGKIECEIKGHTQEYFLISVENRNYKVEKSSVIYAFSQIETLDYKSEQKAQILPYIYPFKEYFEVGFCLIF